MVLNSIFDLQRTKNSSCRRIRYRSNSFNSFACQQSEQMAGTIQLFYLYEDKNSKNMYNLDNSKEDVKKSQTAERMVDKIHLSFIDHPVGHVKIKNLNNWDLNIFHLKRITSKRTIYHSTFLYSPFFFQKNNLGSIEAAYHNFNPYHTALHAADVLQAMHCFISQSQLLTILSPTEIFASLLATALHDADHPGVNQSYLEKTGDFLVDLYKSVSVLEKHHAKFGLCILQENGLSNALELKDWEFVRDCFLKLIPATDITYQGVYQKQFKDLTNYHMANPSLSYTISDRLLIMQVCKKQMALKCSDISNPCRVWPICKEWAIRVCCELFCQGDRERFQWSLQPIPTMDRTKFTLARIQIGQHT
ncbi:high affinity cAMP-specific 3',5'-cyclic phosphodiesterase 7 [Schistosoma bovis]|uniref:High affinity cAMP-specific 3',5'-cyclic phosphodiesterase 7 n=1 Tax=Schistosoma bovis TaxID=6184 RepID=A0A430QG74_SCHBO|nr:high affinity cAMP-specific 3',5'-cyclic phosphodiesterase 7 [Schistosoma bovis]